MKRLKANILLLGLAALAAACGSPVREGRGYVGTVRVEAADTEEEVIRKAASLVPTRRQLDAMENGFIGFLHFGPNTFTGREWGTGFEDPAVFDLKELHTDEWCREMKAAGM